VPSCTRGGAYVAAVLLLTFALGELSQDRGVVTASWGEEAAGCMPDQGGRRMGVAHPRRVGRVLLGDRDKDY
jgi:hypothetical protein